MTDKICSVTECGKPTEAKGYCDAHYRRFRRHGDPLGGRTPDGFPLRFIHEVAMTHTSSGCLPWPYCKTEKGYGMVAVNGKKIVVSRYVCELVRGAPPTPEHEAAHSCGKGHEGCISPMHLSWKTPKENSDDKIKHGTHNRGERHGRAKLTENDVLEILSMKGDVSRSELADRFGVSPVTISNIYAGRKWAWITSNTDGGEEAA